MLEFLAGKTFFIIINRIISWFSVGYLWTKGYRQRKKKYYFVGAALSLAMFLLMVVGLVLIWDVDVMSQVGSFKFWGGRQ